MPKQLILIAGAPSTGKSTLAMDLTTYLSKSGKSAQYVEEWIKAYANRKLSLSPIDQIGVLGGQTFNINNALSANYDYVVACSSPLLCAFYANYYGNDQFLGLVKVAHEWLFYLRDVEQIQVHMFFHKLSSEVYLSRYSNVGRFEDAAGAVKFQNKMLMFFQQHFSRFNFVPQEWSVDKILKSIGVSNGVLSDHKELHKS